MRKTLGIFSLLVAIFFLTEKSRWSYIKQQAKQEDIALKIDTALSTIEKENKELKD